MQYTIKQGMNQDILKSYPDNHFDSIVTDPPYGIEFLGKDWDSNTGAVETWKECYRVLKPGGHILAFSAARTYHHLATNIESVGFEIRDQLMWIYSSGFPKAQDIGKAIQKRQGVEETVERTLNQYGGIANQTEREGGINFKDGKQRETIIDEVIPTSPEAQAWSGWKTALKPAHEPIVMARKPFKGSAIDNVLKHGTGALNIDATRIPFQKDNMATAKSKIVKKPIDMFNGKYRAGMPETHFIVNEKGRFPSNVFGEIPDYQKYFYCPKVSRGERHCGFEQNNIATGNNFGDGLATGVDIMTKAKGSLDHIPNTKQMLEQLGGYYCDKDGNATTPDQHTNLAYVPGKGVIQAHGVTNAYEQLTKNKKGNIISTEDMIEAMGGKLITNNRVWTPELGEFYIHGLKEEYIKWCKKNNKATGSMGNNHPTVKPVALMSYLVKLVTPPGGSVLDPFNGSGSTGMACVEHGFEYTGCELDPAYVDIATRRIEGWYAKTQPDNNFNELFEEKQ